ncbi:hypothetical protein NEOLEDRAFT_1080988, partial [Neolentinus lepideus HHB14362 ss-1]
MWENGWFGTAGVEDYLAQCRGTDPHEFLARMEGFALAGLKGSAITYKSSVSEVRTALWAVINEKLREVTRNSRLNMEYVKYWKRIVKHYHVVIIGWPIGIGFGNLSTVATRLETLQLLKSSWDSGATHWKAIT